MRLQIDDKPIVNNDLVIGHLYQRVDILFLFTVVDHKRIMVAVGTGLSFRADNPSCYTDVTDLYSLQEVKR